MTPSVGTAFRQLRNVGSVLSCVSDTGDSLPCTSRPLGGKRILSRPCAVTGVSFPLQPSVPYLFSEVRSCFGSDFHSHSRLPLLMILFRHMTSFPSHSGHPLPVVLPVQLSKPQSSPFLRPMHRESSTSWSIFLRFKSPPFAAHRKTLDVAKGKPPRVCSGMAATLGRGLA